MAFPRVINPPGTQEVKRSLSWSSPPPSLRPRSSLKASRTGFGSVKSLLPPRTWAGGKGWSSKRFVFTLTLQSPLSARCQRRGVRESSLVGTMDTKLEVRKAGRGVTPAIRGRASLSIDPSGRKAPSRLFPQRESPLRCQGNQFPYFSLVLRRKIPPPGDD